MPSGQGIIDCCKARIQIFNILNLYSNGLMIFLLDRRVKIFRFTCKETTTKAIGLYSLRWGFYTVAKCKHVAFLEIWYTDWMYIDNIEPAHLEWDETK